MQRKKQNKNKKDTSGWTHTHKQGKPATQVAWVCSVGWGKQRTRIFKWDIPGMSQYSGPWYTPKKTAPEKHMKDQRVYIGEICVQKCTLYTGETKECPGYPHIPGRT